MTGRLSDNATSIAATSPIDTNRPMSSGETAGFNSLNRERQGGYAEDRRGLRTLLGR